MSLKQKLTEDMKTAMKSGDKVRLQTIRMILSDFKYAQAQVNAHQELDESTAAKVVASYHKKLSKSLEEFPAGDAKTAVEAEIKIVEDYMPKRVGPEETKKAIQEVLAATADRNFGALMKAVMAKVGTGADGKLVSQLLKEMTS